MAAPARWDEACFAVPAVRALMATGLKTGILCRTEQVGLWETLPGLQVVAMPAKSRDAVAVIRSRWQAGLIWEKGDAADAIIRADLPRRLGPAACDLGKRLTHPLAAAPGPLDHRVRFYLAAVEEMGIPTDKPEFFAAAETPGERIPCSVLLSPESDFGPSHEWPADRWLEIGRKLIDAGWRVTVAAARDGKRPIAEPLAAELGQSVVILDARLLGSVLPSLATQTLVVAADGSLPHLVAHLGATCVTLFGPNDPAWRRPLGKRHAVLWRHVECAPCLLQKCPLDLRCQQELETANVWKTLQEMLPNLPQASLAGTAH